METETKTRLWLILLLMIFVLLATAGNIFDPKLNLILQGIAASVIAAIFIFLFLRDLDRRSDAALSRIEEAVLAISTANSEFRSVNRNIDMGETFWLSLIDELETSREPVWFLGNKLSRWREGAAYRPTLKKKIILRMQNAINAINANQTGNDDYQVFIMVTKDDEIPKWQDFLSSIVSETVRAANPKKSKVESKLKLLKLSPDRVKYSAVLCGNRLAVTAYTSSGRLEDSATFDVRMGSKTSDLYKADLKKLAESKDSEFPKEASSGD